MRSKSLDDMVEFVCGLLDKLFVRRNQVDMTVLGFQHLLPQRLVCDVMFEGFLDKA